MFDFLISGGRLVTGSGSPWFFGAVGIDGDRVRILRGDVSAVEADRTIDASGKAVCPGFIDCHTHSDLLALSSPLHEPKIMQGVTSDLVGVDGMGYAPLSKGNLRSMQSYWASLSGGSTLDADWSSFAEYVDRFHHKSSVNIGAFVPNGALRLEAVGWEDRPATKAEIQTMLHALQKAMEEGALGLSTGLNFPLSAWADTEELIELCKTVARLGGVYVTHVRYEKGDGILDGFKEAVDIGRQSGAPVHISHFSTNPKTRGHPERLLEIIDSARSSGVDVTFDAYPYEYGSGPLTSPLIPYWAKEGGPEALVRRLASAHERARMRADRRAIWDNWDEWNRTHYVSAVASDQNKWCEGLTLQAIAACLHKDPMDAICDLLLEENLQVAINSHIGDENDVKVIMRHPACMVASDGILVGGRPNPRVYGTFPKVLRWLVREEGILTVEEAVRKMTAFPAERFGLGERAELRDGAKADIVVLDPEAVADRSTVAEPRRYPVGIDYVFVNGKLVVDLGQHSGILAGEKLLRKQRSSIV